MGHCLLHCPEVLSLSFDICTNRIITANCASFLEVCICKEFNWILTVLATSVSSSYFRKPCSVGKRCCLSINVGMPVPVGAPFRWLWQVFIPMEEKDSSEMLLSLNCLSFNDHGLFFILNMSTSLLQGYFLPLGFLHSSVLFLFLFFILVGLELELRTVHLQNRCSTAWVTFPVHFALVILETGSCKLFCWPGFQPWSFHSSLPNSWDYRYEPLVSGSIF
jgi:hypothetical protein